MSTKTYTETSVALINELLELREYALAARVYVITARRIAVAHQTRRLLRKQHKLAVDAYKVYEDISAKQLRREMANL